MSVPPAAPRAAPNASLSPTVPVIRVILDHILDRPEGEVFAASDFEHMAERKTLENALRTLTQRGELVRVIRGQFARPLPSGFQARRQVLDRLVPAALGRMGHIAVPDGPSSAYQLGLLAQPPLLLTYLTTFEARGFEIGRVRVTFVPADLWWFVLHDRPAGAIVRTLGWAGSVRAGEAWRELKDRLPVELLREVRLESHRLPLWLANVVLDRSGPSG